VRARGRRITIASHLAGMVFHVGITGELATLALVEVGASEGVVGLHSGLLRTALLLQLPVLLLVRLVRKRSLLVAGQVIALVTSLPLLWFAGVATLRDPWSVGIVFASLTLSAAALQAAGAVWFPLLRGYVEPGEIGSFFGTLRTTWHVMLIAFFAGSGLWLREHPADLGPLFVVVWMLGIARVPLIAALPERDERGGARVGLVRLAAESLRRPDLRRYLTGVAWVIAVRTTVTPFVLVWLRREVGLAKADILYATVATYAGGLVSLYVWGRLVDRAGAAPVLTLTTLGQSAIYGALVGLALCASVGVSGPPPPWLLPAMVALFFLQAVLAAGFGVADTRVLFDLTPAAAPAPTMVVAVVGTQAVASAAPICAGLVLDVMLDGAARPLWIYAGLFGAAAVVQLGALRPLRRLGPA
jgi:hypothetical protein